MEKISQPFASMEPAGRRARLVIASRNVTVAIWFCPVAPRSEAYFENDFILKLTPQNIQTSLRSPVTRVSPCFCCQSFSAWVICSTGALGFDLGFRVIRHKEVGRHGRA